MKRIVKDTSEKFVPVHINATAKDMAGNNGIGRYFFFPGDERRARDMAERFFDNLKILGDARHTIFLGTIKLANGHKLDVAAVSSGMGCPSLDIILYELLMLGAKRFLRVGSAGSLWPKYIKAGDVVVVTRAVRDDGVTHLYAPPEVPATASQEFLYCALKALKETATGELPFCPADGIIIPCHQDSQPYNVAFGMGHTKSSLNAREYKIGPLAEENHRYMTIMHECGAIGSSMEESLLFLLTNLHDWKNKEARGLDESPADRKRAILAGAVWAIVGDNRPFAPKADRDAAVERAINLALETVKILGQKELAY